MCKSVKAKKVIWNSCEKKNAVKVRLKCDEKNLEYAFLKLFNL